MTNEAQIALTVVIATLLLLLLLGTVVLLLVVSTNRRHLHRAALAEADLRREQEVMLAEREATRHTLHDMARELHDNVGQLLTVAQLGVDHVLADGATDTRLVAARDTLEHGIGELRRLGRDLNTDLWQQRSLVDAISAEADRIERVARVRVHVEVQGTPPVLPPDHTTILFRVLQEVVNNALKHSRADTLTITLAAGPPWSLTLSDNGRGFDATTTAGHGGLVNIRRRCALIGLQASCTTAPGQGCTWTITHTPAHGT
jgi:signal transduction histidine kinase